jgi:hypothetical protein
MELKSKTTYIAATVLAAVVVASGLMMAFPLQTASAQEINTSNENTNTNTNQNTNTNTVTTSTTVNNDVTSSVSITIISGPVRPTPE